MSAGSGWQLWASGSGKSHLIREGRPCLTCGEYHEDFLRETAGTRVIMAVMIARRYGDTDGDHHKAWVIDQMVRALTGGAEDMDDPGIAP